MAKGQLRVNGQLDVSQFWPGGGSDADTVVLSVNQSSFTFSPDPASQPFMTTRVFEGARVVGSHSSDAIHGGKITVRLQGIDATELHFAAELRQAGPPASRKKLEHNGTKYRQFLGETATTKLSDFIGKGRSAAVKCEVLTTVDRPGDVFDTYGRLVGTLYVMDGTRQINVNNWLTSSGWTFPAFYNTMTVEDITTIRRLADSARKGGKGVWKKLTPHIGHLNVALQFRPHGAPNPRADIGPVLFPKIFRREVRLFVSQLNHLFTGDFRAFLATQDDPWLTVADFLKDPTMPRPAMKSKNGNLSSLIDAHDDFVATPGDIVFFDKPSKLIGANGKTVSAWQIK